MNYHGEKPNICFQNSIESIFIKKKQKQTENTLFCIYLYTQPTGTEIVTKEVTWDQRERCDDLSSIFLKLGCICFYLCN